uniref:Transposase n=1 Tax=Ascaris lumbricoides TaxID=6252 RepID=A0A0M3IRE4_ASCLU
MVEMTKAPKGNSNEKAVGYDDLNGHRWQKVWFGLRR